MNKIDISKIEHIYALEGQSSKFDEINIYTAHIKGNGVLRYAFRYALWALKRGGFLHVFDTPTNTFSLSKGHIDFWQVKFELFKTARGDVKVIDISPDVGKITVFKDKDSLPPSGFSFGIVFSGRESELHQIFLSVDSILNIRNEPQIPYEVVICGPKCESANLILARYSQQHVKYLEWTPEFDSKRFLVCKKKNHIIRNLNYSIAVISHARIVFPENFIVEMIGRQFDVCTPKVVVNVDGCEYDYLDFGLIGSYCFDQPVRFRTLTSTHINNHELLYMRNRVPYIDGGLTVYNLHAVRDMLMDEYIAWGEAEDIDMCAQSYHSGLLLTYIRDVKCVSTTLKDDFKLMLPNSLKCKILRFLARLGWI